MGWERLAAQSGFATVQELLHGVSGGRPHAGPPHQERAAWATQNGGQLSQVPLTPLTLYRVWVLKNFKMAEVDLWSVTLIHFLKLFSRDGLSLKTLYGHIRKL